MALNKILNGKSQDRKNTTPDMIVFHKISMSYKQALDIYKTGNQSVNFVVNTDGNIGYIIPISKAGYLCETSTNATLMNYYARSSNRVVKTRRTDANLYCITIDIICDYENDDDMPQEQYESIVWLVNYIRSTVLSNYGIMIPLNKNYITGYDKIIPETSYSIGNPGEFIYDKIISSLSISKTALLTSASSKVKNIADLKLKVGTKITLQNVKIYDTATSTNVRKVASGVYYLYDGIILGNRYAITNSAEYIGKTPSSTFIKGYIYVDDIMNSNPIIPEVSDNITPSTPYSKSMSSSEALSLSNVNQAICAGKKINLNKTAVYSSPTEETPFSYKTGTYYLYDGISNNGRYRITNVITNVGKTPMGDYTIGFVDSGAI